MTVYLAQYPRAISHLGGKGGEGKGNGGEGKSDGRGEGVRGRVRVMIRVKKRVVRECMKGKERVG